MTTQTELDQDLLEVLERHLESRRELLKRVRAELMGLKFSVLGTRMVLSLEEVASVMDRLIDEAKLP